MIRTDHCALTYFKTTGEVMAQQARYLDTLANFDFAIEYRPNKHCADALSHSNADALSCRQPCEVGLEANSA